MNSQVVAKFFQLSEKSILIIIAHEMWKDRFKIYDATTISVILCKEHNNLWLTPSSRLIKSW